MDAAFAPISSPSVGSDSEEEGRERRLRQQIQAWKEGQRFTRQDQERWRLFFVFQKDSTNEFRKHTPGVEANLCDLVSSSRANVCLCSGWEQVSEFSDNSRTDP